MFTEITLRNFRTHKLTTIHLDRVTLLIGNNNSGKTNFLAGIAHFCHLVRRGRPENKKTPVVRASKDWYPQRYRMAGEEEPIGFAVDWHNVEGKVNYEMEIYPDKNFPDGAGCREKISIQLGNSPSKELDNGYDEPTNLIGLRKAIEESSALETAEKKLCNSFFSDIANTFIYQFQPSFLKGLVINQAADVDDEEKVPRPVSRPETDQTGINSVRIPADLRYTGENLQNLIKHIKEHEERTFTRFITLMRRFERTFQGVRYNQKTQRVIWEFDLGQPNVDEFSPDLLSDGLMKAAAISLLASLQRPPALILLEEIENGINPGNIQELMEWIWRMTAPDNQRDGSSQFMITSHSPSVLREFSDRLDCVYTFRLDKRRSKSDAIDLNHALETLVRLGTVEGEIIEEESTGKRSVKIPKYQLAELWYSGTIG